ncbi:MAG: Lipoprotein-releasing system ATP-binding protein LolD [Microgenomates bacterium OLB23]|nr:MAG: Lipoprotein-releasing system ATP-binding protein LolD [Microgenomates bacterium OLB23]
MADTFIKATNITKTFRVGDEDVQVLKEINLEIQKGDFAIIFGPSGSGKSTLLHALLGLEAPTTGNILIEGKDFYAMTEDERAIYRRHRVGMIYQQALWINSLNVCDNVTFALNLLDYNSEMIAQKGDAVLKMVGMENWASHRPTELSSGQQQKISLARAMVIDPVLMVADEPTGNLDTVSGLNLMQTFLDINAKGITIIMITHDLDYLKYATKLIHVLDGSVVEVYTPKKRAKKVEQGVAGEVGKTVDLRSPDYLKKLQL